MNSVFNELCKRLFYLEEAAYHGYWHRGMGKVKCPPPPPPPPRPNGVLESWRGSGCVPGLRSCVLWPWLRPLGVIGSESDSMSWLFCWTLAFHTDGVRAWGTEGRGSFWLFRKTKAGWISHTVLWGFFPQLRNEWQLIFWIEWVEIEFKPC